MDNLKIGLVAAFASTFLLFGVSVEDPLQIEGNPELLNHVMQNEPGFDKFIYKPTIASIEGNWPTILVGLLSYYHQMADNVKYERTVFPLSDGSEVLIDSNEENNLWDPVESDKPLIIIIPGYFGSLHDHYIMTFIQQIKDEYDWVILNYKGWNHKLKNSKPYSCYDIEAFKEPFMKLAESSRGKRQVFAYASSMGGNVLLNILSDENVNDLVSAAFAYNPATDLKLAFENLNKSLSGFYDNIMTNSVKSQLDKTNSTALMKEEYYKMTGKTDFEKVMNDSISVDLLDRFVSKPIYGFNMTIEELRKDRSGITHSEKIQTPLMIIYAENDPVLHDLIDHEKLLQNPNIILGKTRYGGHLGHFDSFLNFDQFQNQVIKRLFQAFRK